MTNRQLRRKRRVIKKDKAEAQRLKKFFEPSGRFSMSVSFNANEELFDLPLSIVRHNLRIQLVRAKSDFEALCQRAWDDMKLDYFFDEDNKKTWSER